MFIFCRERLSLVFLNITADHVSKKGLVFLEGRLDARSLSTGPHGLQRISCYRSFPFATISVLIFRLTRLFTSTRGQISKYLYNHHQSTNKTVSTILLSIYWIAVRTILVVVAGFFVRFEQKSSILIWQSVRFAEKEIGCGEKEDLIEKVPIGFLGRV